MGTASFSVSAYASDRSGSARSSYVRTSGAFTTSGTAGALADGAGAISLRAGEVLHVHASEAMRVSFGGTATTSTGHYIAADENARFEIMTGDAGAVSIIDVA